jgi:hypothetical protein
MTEQKWNPDEQFELYISGERIMLSTHLTSLDWERPYIDPDNHSAGLAREMIYTVDLNLKPDQCLRLLPATMGDPAKIRFVDIRPQGNTEYVGDALILDKSSERVKLQWVRKF